MAITGIDTIEGKQIIAAGAVSAKSAEMAYNDENGNPITGYLTAIPDPITIGVQEGDTLDTDYDGLKIVKATANGNEHINLHKKSTDQWLIHGNLVPTSPGSNKYLITDNSGAMHWDNTSALAYDSAFEQSGGYITAYNGSAFKAGDELPSGVMNTSALEYNAVNEISGYNGSAIAQYGAEKQWLQHDDTIVHVANSAQYAFGVNLSAVAQLLGVDETVLWSGSKNTTAGSEALSESYMNFNKIDIYLTFDTASNPQRAQSITRYYVGNHTTAQPLYVYATANNITGNTLTAETLYISGSPVGTGFSLLGGTRQVNSTVTTGITSYNCRLIEIRGIGRKEV